MNTKLILGVDPQDCFMKPDGPLYVPHAERLLDNMELIKVTARQYSVKHIFTSDGHVPEDKELADKPDFKASFPPHAMIELAPDGKHIVGHSKGFRIDGQAAEWDYMMNKGHYLTRAHYTQKEFNDIVHKNRSFILVKNVFDVFDGNPHAERVFTELGPKVIFVYGVTTDICVDQAISGLLERNYQVVVIEDAIKELHSNACTTEWKKHGVKFIKTTQLVDNLKQEYA